MSRRIQEAWFPYGLVSHCWLFWHPLNFDSAFSRLFAASALRVTSDGVHGTVLMACSSHWLYQADLSCYLADLSSFYVLQSY